MFLSDTAVKRPIFVTMVTIGVLALGAYGFVIMPVDLFPEVDIPYVTIQTQYPGAGPEEVESEVTKKIEEAVNTASGIKHINSQSFEGFSLIIIEFEIDEDVADKSLEVREKLAPVLAELPDDAEDPAVQRFDFGAEPILGLSISGRRSLKEVTSIAKEVIQRRLESISGVGRIDLIGGAEREIQIELDANRMAAHELSVQDVYFAVQNANVEFPGGRIDQGATESTVRTLGKLQDWRSFRDLIIDTPQGVPVRLRDVASVVDSYREQRSYARHNGNPAVSLQIVRQSGANTVRMVDNVMGRIDELKKELPPDIAINVVFDNSIFIRDAVEDVETNIIIGAILATLIIALFLGNWRTTLISGLAIPTSLIASFGVMAMLDYSINFMSLLGLSIAVGLVIDDAIVVIENVHRRFENTNDPHRAAAEGTSEIALAVLAATLTIVVVFVPIGYMGGIVGRFFKQFALTVAIAIALSMLIAFTVTPMLFSRLIKKLKGENPSADLDGQAGEKVSPLRWIATRFNAGFESFKQRYRKALAWSLRHRLAVMIVATLSFIGAVALAPFVGTEWMPPRDESVIYISFEMAPGTTLSETAKLTEPIEQLLHDIPEVTAVNVTLGGLATAPSKGRIVARLMPMNERDKTVFETMDELRPRLAAIPGLFYSMAANPTEGGDRPIAISIQGEDIDVLATLADAIEDTVEATPGAIDVQNSLSGKVPELQIDVDRNLARELNVSMYAIAQTIRLLVEGDKVTTYKEGDEEYDVRMRLKRDDRSNFEDVGRFLIESTKEIPGRDNFFVPLRQLAKFERRGGPTEIFRLDRRREVRISGNIDPAFPAGDVRQDIADRIATLEMPPGYEVRFVGEAEIQEESNKRMMLALVMAVLFIFIVLASQYESLIDPFAIMFSLPLALVGALFGLFVFGSALSVVAMVGIVLLMGLVTKNAILLIDFVKQARRRGLSRAQAILDAGTLRLRPILMTAAATIFAVVPIAFAIGPGAEMRAPMGRAVIGGMLSSTFLTLLVVPVVYTILDDMKRFFGSLPKESNDADPSAPVEADATLHP